MLYTSKCGQKRNTLLYIAGDEQRPRLALHRCHIILFIYLFNFNNLLKYNCIIEGKNNWKN